MVSFEPLTESHLPGIASWLADGETYRWYGQYEPRDVESLRTKWLVEGARQGTRCFLVRANDEAAALRRVATRLERDAAQPPFFLLNAARPEDPGMIREDSSRSRATLALATT